MLYLDNLIGNYLAILKVVSSLHLTRIKIAARFYVSACTICKTRGRSYNKKEENQRGDTILAQERK